MNQNELNQLNQQLAQAEKELDRLACKATLDDYCLAIASGLLAGVLDSLYVGEMTLERAESQGNARIEQFVRKIARLQGYQGSDLKGAVHHLEKSFSIPADMVTNEFGGGLQHHLRDFSHHPSPIGLACSLYTQFTRQVIGTTTAGKLNIVSLPKGCDRIGGTFQEKIVFGILHWMLHLVSDMAGSTSSIARGRLGTGIPGPIGSLLKELSALPFFAKTNDEGNKEFSVWVSRLFNGTLFKDSRYLDAVHKFDLRTEVGIASLLARQSLPVLLNEAIVRLFCFFKALRKALASAGTQISMIDLSRLGSSMNHDTYGLEPDMFPLSRLTQSVQDAFDERICQRMLTVASMTFSAADLSDAAMRAAIESGGDSVLFVGKFVTRINLVGMGRTGFAVFKEVSHAQKEQQLLEERTILQQKKTGLCFEQLQQFKQRLEEQVLRDMSEDLENAMKGLCFMEEGVQSGDSDRVITGSVLIQNTFKKESQFASQQEFDLLMESDTPFCL